MRLTLVRCLTVLGSVALSSAAAFGGAAASYEDSAADLPKLVNAVTPEDPADGGSLAVSTLEGFSPSGGWAIIEPETMLREKFYYTSFDPSTHELLNVIRPFAGDPLAPSELSSSAAASTTEVGNHASGAWVVPFPSLEPPPLPGAEVNDPEEYIAPALDALLPELPDTELSIIGLALSEEDGGTKACKFTQTSWARGGIGEGDAGVIGADTNLGAHAFTQADTGLTSYTKRNATAFMEAGARFKLSGGSANGAITFPWHSLGELTTIVDAPEGVSAEARAGVYLRIRDLTAGVTYTDYQAALIPEAGPQRGNSRHIYRNGGTNAFSQFFRKDHSYAAYIRVNVRATVTRNVEVDPLTQAEAIADYYDASRNFRAWLEFVKLKFNNYDCRIL